MRHLVFRLVAVIALLAATLLFAPSANAAGGCVSLAEYKRVETGMTLAKAHRIFGTKGKLLFRNPGTVSNGARVYKSCAGLARARGNTVQLQYNNFRDNAAMRVVHKQVYRSR